jgi:hypothetical protein
MRRLSIDRSPKHVWNQKGVQPSPWPASNYSKKKKVGCKHIKKRFV